MKPGERQFAITCSMTGLVTLVNHPYAAGRNWQAQVYTAARQVGYRYPADCDVHLVPIGRETPLPFDELPLVIRRGHPNGVSS